MILLLLIIGSQQPHVIRFRAVKAMKEATMSTETGYDNKVYNHWRNVQAEILRLRNNINSKHHLFEATGNFSNTIYIQMHR